MICWIKDGGKKLKRCDAPRPAGGCGRQAVSLESVVRFLSGCADGEVAAVN
jgi:hypothetical protein